MSHAGETTTVAGVSDDLFVQRSTDQHLRSRRRRRRTWALMTMVLLGSAGAAGYRFWDQRAEQQQVAAAQEAARQLKLCPGLGELSGAGYSLSMQHGECIGWTAEQPYFTEDPGIAPIIDKIIRENQRVAALPGPGLPYVRVGVLMPTTSKGTASAMTNDSIKHSLQGVHAAQLRANSDTVRLVDGRPKIQMVLANEGQDLKQWPDAVRQLAILATPGEAHPLVAVTGMSISRPETQAAAAELGRLGIPSIGAVITATDVVAPKLFKVSPSNLDHVRALKRYVDDSPALRSQSGYLVYDRSNDNYVATLKSAFIEQFPALDLKQNSNSFAGKTGDTTGVTDLFNAPVQNICTARAHLILYAGRDIDLPELITALMQSTACGRDRGPFTILTATTGMGRIQPNQALLKDMQRARITVVSAATTVPDRWAKHEPGTPYGYTAFEKTFKEAGIAAGDLYDGYAIMHYDAALTTVQVIQRTSSSIQESGPTAKTVTADMIYHALGDSHLSGEIEGASGTLTFNGFSDGWPRNKVMPFVEVPATGASPHPDFTSAP